MPEDTIGTAHGPRSATAENPAHGITLTGEFLGISEGKPYHDRNKVEHTPGIVDVLVGRYVERVEFNDLVEAAAAIGSAKERDTVTLKVRPTGPWDSGAKRWGRVSYRGRSD